MPPPKNRPYTPSLELWRQRCPHSESPKKQIIQTMIKPYGVGNGPIITQSMCYNPKKSIAVSTGGALPHSLQSHVLQYITFRLADSLPESKLAELHEIRNEWLSKHPQPWDSETEQLYKALIGDRIDRWLDAGHGSCVLKHQTAIKIIADTLKFHEDKKYYLYDYVIMPNHVHLIIFPFEELHLIMHSIKSYTASKINRTFGLKGPLWQKESFDRMIRSVKDYRQKSDYIRHNPDAIPGVEASLPPQ